MEDGFALATEDSKIVVIYPPYYDVFEMDSTVVALTVISNFVLYFNKMTWATSTHSFTLVRPLKSRVIRP